MGETRNMAYNYDNNSIREFGAINVANLNVRVLFRNPIDTRWLPSISNGWYSASEHCDRNRMGHLRRCDPICGCRMRNIDSAWHMVRQNHWGNNPRTFREYQHRDAFMIQTSHRRFNRWRDRWETRWYHPPSIVGDGIFEIIRTDQQSRPNWYRYQIIAIAGRF